MTEQKQNVPDDTVFRVFGALDNLNERLKSVEGKVPDYTADMLEIYRNIGVLTKRLEAVEQRLEAAEQKLRDILMED